MATDVGKQPVATPAGLRRDLSVWQAVGMSIALMAPSAAEESFMTDRTADRTGQPA